MTRPAAQSFAATALSILLSVTGCETEAYCFDCDSSDAGSGGSSQGSGGGPGFPMPRFPDGGLAGFPSACGANLESDTQNCGACGNRCELPNAFAKCSGGFCVVDTCAPGYHDIDGVVANGCEYACVRSASAEICDGEDNDCNGLVDEVYDLSSDRGNCGACGRVCALPNANVECSSGACVFVDCQIGFVDRDGDTSDAQVDSGASNGCEYSCTPTNGGVEICDNVDNDCDGEVDEGFDVTKDAQNCGGCGNDCGLLFPGAVTDCSSSQCGFVECRPGFWDLDGVLENGCEYPCTPTNGGVEICDNVDNDCNGLRDDGVLPGVGAVCGATDVGPCAFGLARCREGTLVCEGEVAPGPEYCDGLDNDCDGDVDEGCPEAQEAARRIDEGPLNALPSSQLHAANRGQDVFAAYVQHNGDNANIRFNASRDSGVTWLSSAVGVEMSANDEVEPWVLASPTRVYVLYERFESGVRRLYVRDSAAPFTGFSGRRRLDRMTGGGVDAFFVRGAVVRSDAGADHLVVVWQRIDLANGNRDVVLQASPDGGRNWLASDRRVNEAVGQAEFPAIATDGAGRAFIAWRNRSTAEIITDVFDFNTLSFRGNVSVSAGNPGTSVSVGADSVGNVFVAWADLRSGKKQIRVNESTDSGATFGSDGAIVNRDSTFADASNPVIAVREGRVAVAWEDTRTGLSDIYASHNEAPFSSWPPVSVRVDGGSVAGTSASVRPSITFGSGDAIFVAWQDARDGRMDIYGNHSFDGGRAFQPFDLRLDTGHPAGVANSFSPFVFAAGASGPGVVVWLDQRDASNGRSQNADVYTNFFR